MARRKRPKKGSVHPILRSAYGDRARNLKDTILSLLPPPPHSCHCDSTATGCLRCRGADHLLCQGDPTAYRHLISYAQCAVSSDAPAPPAVYSVPKRSQRQIVTNTMELMKRNRSSNSNLLCKSYDMIGDLLMEYLLRHCSVFVPNGRNIKGFIQSNGLELCPFSFNHPFVDPQFIIKCTHCGHNAQSRSKCLYHSSLALFKSLIRDAQRCRHRMLLHKHCYVNFLSKDGQLGPKIVLAHKLLATWIHWLFLHVIVPVISSNFYATEKESKRYEVFYYKKPIWGSVVKGCIEKLKMQSFCPVDSDAVRNIFNDSRCFGFSRFRFLPKENCLRPLAILNKPTRLPFLNKWYRSVNSSLNELHVILKTIKVQNPNLLGSSVFDYNDVYQKLHGFISKVKDGTFFMPEVFTVVADVSKAFDSIDQDKLLKIMEGSIMQNDEYIVGNYRRVMRKKNFVCPVYNASLGFISWHNEGSDASNTLVQVCVFCSGHSAEALLQPYLGKLEETTGNGQGQQSLLMRYLDDFIFVSTSKQQALGFLERLRRGFREYNCYMNCKKFGLNFEVEMGNFTNKRYVGEDGIPFLPWSGLLVNCITLEIQADYTRYWDVDIRSTITAHKSNNPGDLLRSKLFSYMLPKSYVILYDSTINSPATVRLNAYQAFLLCAMKFHCYVCEMHCSVPSPDQLLKIIKKTCRYTYNLIFKRVRDAETCFGICAVLRLKMKEIIWLGFICFLPHIEKETVTAQGFAASIEGKY
ncbi:telomerase reverse transcriptase catalytic subunit [Carex littledalei]|uniref:Telomerase reverse transcriptase n=1 Tax=Carex littledalei TaxID=544730 RepID=A0A833RBL5_9POAL|nr:telomerase reverse transcriptase catalytic subunit [Carex littledalei]